MSRVYLKVSRCINFALNSVAAPGTLTAFAKDERGTVAMIFGLMAVVMVMLMGGAVDTGRWLHAQSQTKAAVDAAVLAGARSLQITGGDAEIAISTAKNFYASNVESRPRIKKDTIDFHLNDAHTALAATGTAFIDTPFLAIANIPQLPLWKDSDAEQSAASTEIGGNNDQALEISIMLDVTGSMGGTKIEDLRTAANDLIDIILPESANGNSARVALAPFAETVRPGSSYLTAVRGSRPASIKVIDRQGKTQTLKLTECVSERSGTSAYNDAAPSTALLGAVYTKAGTCTPGASVVPLTSDKARLKSTIASLTASGGTAGHLGSAWAWYLLSPKWASLWGGESQPANYGDAKVRKIAILMTDGEYNTQYDAKGVMTTTYNTSALNGASDQQARQVCAAMKTEGIEVYTVGFNLTTQSAIDTLDYCASNAGTAYLAQDGDQLRKAFRDIAIKLSPLRLTN